MEGENSRELLSIRKLKGAENWNMWKFQVSVILKTQGAWDIVTGAKVLRQPAAVTAPDAEKRQIEKEIAEWIRIDAIAKKVIVTTILEQCMIHIMRCSYANEIWTKLEEMVYSKKGRIDTMIMTKILLTLPSSYDHFVSAWESTPAAERTKTNLIARLTIEEFRLNQREGDSGNALTSKTRFNRGESRGQYQDRGKRGTWKLGKCNICDTWYLDSGASEHMTHKRECGDGTYVGACGRGIKSVSDKNYCQFLKDNGVVAVGVRENSLFIMKFKVDYPKIQHRSDEAENKTTATAAEADMMTNWHEKLVHQNFARTKEILQQHGIKVKKSKSETFCEACALGKSHRLPFPQSQSRTKCIGEVIHADLCGPIPEMSMKGSAKSDVHSCMEDFIKKTERHCAKGIKYIRTDNGSEFVNQKVDSLLSKHGIQHQKTVAYCPERNGSAERKQNTDRSSSNASLLKGFRKKVLG
ncbi:uncharacterized protein LOC143218553 [Lasioglossum baleicum]|uniref:uncharacterized protein LOC143218553 n=1 Tax=Lasioglossum baleicum TaxID=434251 RepID=UPI003FCDA2E1